MQVAHMRAGACHRPIRRFLLRVLLLCQDGGANQSIVRMSGAVRLREHRCALYPVQRPRGEWVE